ncbi:hypothetical protein Syun_002041 [Stephania yunnanensis]|uniref:Uncharacterized protein n=1 Tax=Stephania yunnanensis TaxID=152371 RepID=A0AAP0QBH3_9MAGN
MGCSCISILIPTLGLGHQSTSFSNCRIPHITRGMGVRAFQAWARHTKCKIHGLRATSCLQMGSKARDRDESRQGWVH